MVAKVAAEGWVIGGGYGKLTESTIRIGHMGDHTVGELEGLLDVLGDALKMSFRVVVADGVSTKGLEPLSRDDRFEVLAISDSNTDDFAEAPMMTADGLIVRSATKVDETKLAGAPLAQR